MNKIQFHVVKTEYGLGGPYTDSELAEYCREWWYDICDPDHPELFPDSDAAIIRYYFDQHDSEYVTTMEFDDKWLKMAREESRD